MEHELTDSILSDVDNGLQGWTLKEILTDVLYQENDMSNQLSKKINEFDDLTNKQDNLNASKVYYELEKMMFKSNPMLKILRLKLSAIGGLSDD